MQHPEEKLLERYYYEGWNKAAIHVTEQVLADNVQFRGSFRRKPLRGIAAFNEYMQKTHKAIFNNRVQILQVVLAENRRTAAVRLMNRGIHKGDFFGVQGSGHEISWGSAAFFTFSQDGKKITDIWVIGDIDGLKNQLGASVGASAFTPQKCSLEGSTMSSERTMP